MSYLLFTFTIVSSSRVLTYLAAKNLPSLTLLTFLTNPTQPSPKMVYSS